MTQLTLQNFNTLVQNLATAAQKASAQPLNFEDGSVLLALFEAEAGQALWLQYLTFLVLATTRLATSSGSDCDSFGADFGFTRLPPINATGNVTFSRYTATQSAFLPAYISSSGLVYAGGVQVLTADGTETFNLIVDPTNPSYTVGPPEGYNLLPNISSITLPVIADTPGSGGNVLAGTISLLVGGVAGVDTVTNAVGTTGGMDQESDAAFKARFVNFINSRAQGTEYAVGYAIQQVQQGLTWSIQENTNAGGGVQVGTCVVTIDDGSGDPPPALIATCASAIDAIRPIGSFMIVQGPTKVLASMSVTLTLGPTANQALVEANVGQALTQYINSLAVGDTLAFTKLAQIIYGADVAVMNASYTVNGMVVDMVPTESQVIRAGTIVVG
jgi:uncharacterized phage protein gp47/JayE